jgi:hypothetical protein
MYTCLQPILLCSSPSYLLWSRCGHNNNFARPESEARASFTSMEKCTRVQFFAPPTELQPVILSLRKLSPMMDDLIPSIEEVVELASIGTAPTQWDEEAKRRNEAVLGKLKFATLGGVDPVFEAFQQALRDYLGKEIDLECMTLVPCDAAVRTPFLGSMENPCMQMHGMRAARLHRMRSR